MYHKKMTLMQKRSMQGYLYILPWIVGFLLFFLVPIVQTAIYSFNKIDKNTLELSFLALDNYIYAFRGDAQFPMKLVASLKGLIDVPLILIFSYFVALLLRKDFKGSTAVKSIFFLTVIMSSDLFIRMQMSFGGVNNAQFNSTVQETQQMFSALEAIDISQYFRGFGFDTQWITYLNNAISNIFTTMIRSGVQIFIFLAALHSIPNSFYEASQIEGATAWEIFWTITFPMTGPMILVNTIYTIVDSFGSSLNQVILYIREFTRKFELGYASAMAWIYFLSIALIIGVVYLLVRKKIFYYND